MYDIIEGRMDGKKPKEKKRKAMMDMIRKNHIFNDEVV